MNKRHIAVLLLLSTNLSAAESPFPLVNALSPSSNAVEYQWRGTPLSGGPSLSEHRGRGTFIVHKSTTDTWSVSQTVAEMDISKPITIPESGVVVPQSLWDIETGAGFRRKLSERKDVGVSGSIGSASDKPYHSIHETTLRLTGTYRIPSREENAWIFFLSYSNNRHFANNIPLPGFAYVVHSPKNGLDALVGFPFLAFNYRTKRANQRFSIFGPNNFSAESSYKVRGSLEAYGGFDWNERSWLRANRNDNAKRLFLEQKRWSFGFRFPIADKIRIDLGSGYEFNRRFYENRKATDDDIPQANLTSAWTYYAKAGVRW